MRLAFENVVFAGGMVIAALLLAGCPNLLGESDEKEEKEEKPWTPEETAEAPYNFSDPWAGDYRMPGPSPIDDGEDRYVFALPRTVAERVRMAGTMTEWDNDPIDMAYDAEQGYWWVEADVEAGDEYKFILGDDLDDAQWIGDPYGRAFSSCENENSIVFESEYEWSQGAQDFERPPREELVIYEMHMADFTRDDPEIDDEEQGTLAGAADEYKVEYLRDLGVNAVELMPVQEWPGEWYSWGYNTSGFFAIENSLGTEVSGVNAHRELKEFIDTMHRNGIAVILDVVYNHTANENNYLWHIDQETYFDPDGTPWGNRTDFRNDEVQKFFLDNAIFLLEEFNIDGFRFDATEYMDQEGFFEGVLRELVENGYGDRYYILEHFGDQEPIREFNRDYGGEAGEPILTSWGTGYKDAMWEALDDQSAEDLGAPTYYHRDDGWNDPREVVHYFSSHDEGTLNARHSSKPRQVALAATHLLSGMGTPMIWMGDEFLREHYGNYHPDEDGAGTAKENNVIDWEEKRKEGEGDTPHPQDVLEFYQGMIRLRRDNPALRLSPDSYSSGGFDPASDGDFQWVVTPGDWDVKDATTDEEGHVIGYSLNHSGNLDGDRFVVLLNYGQESDELSVPFPEEGTWELVVDSHEFAVDPDGIDSGAHDGTVGTNGTHDIVLEHWQGLVYRYLD